MLPEELVFNLLANDGAVTALIDNRIFPNQVPIDKGREGLDIQNFIVVSHHKNDQDERCLSGERSIKRTLIRTDYTSQTDDDFKLLANAIEDALDNYSDADTLAIFQAERQDMLPQAENEQSYHGSQIFLVIT